MDTYPYAYYRELLRGVKTGHDVLTGKVIPLGETLPMKARENFVFEL